MRLYVAPVLGRVVEVGDPPLAELEAGGALDGGDFRLNWLSKGATGDSANAVKAELGKLVFLRGLDARTLDLAGLPAERRRFLATVGRRLTAQSLDRGSRSGVIRCC
ncbi:hypothetical protein [Streptomyces sp. NPDC037389]|uniref:hypothetical protein n=1 Tax=Streptomyces sp. NPDC037389 TaxID=3155369 RepID=UPI0033F23CC5